MENKTFQELKPEIDRQLRTRLVSMPDEYSGFTLVDGFVMQSVQEKLGGLYIGGKSIPMVMVIGNATGRVYYFALKALLPNL